MSDPRYRDLDPRYVFRHRLADNPIYRLAAFAAAERATRCRKGYGHEVLRVFDDGCEVEMDDGYAVQVRDEDMD